VAGQLRPGQSQWERLRVEVLTRAMGLCECAECRALGRDLIASEVDHIVPLWAGGAPRDPANLQAMARECHAAKSAAEAKARAGGG
jgi:5-methylcytosine-specific restriction enzyme A